MTVEKHEIWLDGGQLLSLDGRLSAVDREDVLQSTLYFQLAASKKVDKLQHIQEWFEVYQQCLRAFGWRMHGDGELHERYPGSISFTLMDLLSALVRNGLPFALAGLTDLGRPQDRQLAATHARQFFEQSYAVLEPGERPLHQVAMLLGTASAGAQMNVLLIHFQTHQVLTGDLSQARFKSRELHGTITASWLGARPDPLLFSEFKPVILERLKARAGQLILPISADSAGRT